MLDKTREDVLAAEVAVEAAKEVASDSKPNNSSRVDRTRVVAEAEEEVAEVAVDDDSEAYA